MAEISFLLKGYFIGMLLAFPIGPVGIICVRRMLVEGRRIGIASGFGAAAADALYAAAAGLGLGLVSSVLTVEKFWMHLFGGLFLIGMGVYLFLAKAHSKTYQIQGRGVVSAFITTFFITLANPAVFFSYAGIMAGLGLAHAANSLLDHALVIAGVFTGSASWWLVIAYSPHFAETMDHANIRILNRVTGVILCGFGLWALLTIH